MSKKPIFSRLTSIVAALCAATAIAQTAPPEPSEELAEVTVTGSRVITNGNDSPTPVTVVTMEDLQASRPTTVFEGLQELPVFSGGSGGAVGGRTGQGGNNNSIASLNLRGLGSVRGLVLFNGHRVPPQNLNGQVDINQIPQLVLQRVDVQTGGSSAVYGSDAITGVVNLIVDRKLTGVRVNAQYGMSDRSDDRSSEIAAAFGGDVFGGRGHVIASVQSHYDAGLLRADREWIQAPNGGTWSLVGAGTAASPYFISQYSANTKTTFGGVIVCPAGTTGAAGAAVPTACPTRPLVGQNFTGNGVLTPFINGTPIPNSTNQIGGDGLTPGKTSLKTPVKFKQFYGRFDFSVTDNVSYFLESYLTKETQLSWLANLSSGGSANTSLTNGYIMSVDNAFLPAAYRSALVAVPGTTTFNVGKNWNSNFYDSSRYEFTMNDFYLNTGLEGKFGSGYNWEVSGTKSRVTQNVLAFNTWDSGKLFAALDAVMVTPANVGASGQAVGTVVCNVSLTNPGLYPGCVPMNIFGPTATTSTMWEYVRKPTNYKGITETSDFEGYVSGAPFNTWAGPVNMALSGEWRKLDYELISEGEPANVDPVSCTGLRFNCVPPSANNVGTSIYPNGTAGLRPVSQTVREASFEAEIPVLADVGFARKLTLNPAFRRAEYSSTGTPSRQIPITTTEFQANTWKVGLNWQLNDAITVRATRSRDFRAPNMSELYLPGRIQGNTVTDRLIINPATGQPGLSVSTQQQQGGNPNLKPEVGFTTTVGVVFKPRENISVAVDGFDISISDAITGIDGTTANIQDACYDSGGASIYCTLQVRPGGYSRTPANQAVTNAATVWITQTLLNLSQTHTQGVDVEANWGALHLFGRPLSLRGLVTYQPHIWLIQDLVTTDDAAGVSSPQLRALASIRVGLTENLSLNWSTRWRSELANVSQRIPNNVVLPGYNHVASAAFSNVTFNYKVPQVTGGGLDVYLNVLNVFDKIPPAYAPLASGSAFSAGAGSNGVGFYPADDGIGRYFNFGLRYRM
jgi:outer membrane receptor protein involved in Fe transport